MIFSLIIIGLLMEVAGFWLVDSGHKIWIILLGLVLTVLGFVLQGYF